MATGDIKSVTINSDGWSAAVVIEGWAGKAGTLTYSHGDEAAGTSKMVFTVVSEGYNSSGTLGTVTRSVVSTKTVRKAYPNNAQLDEATSGADLTIRVALGDFIYVDDNTGAGKSGTAPTVTVAVGWANDGTNNTNAVTGLAVTNNSTLVYPKAIASWDEFQKTATAMRVKGNFTVGCNAFHRSGVACVRFDATGLTSSHNQNATVTQQTATRRPKTGRWVSAYETTVTLSGFTQGESIDLRMRVYPKVGDAASVLDTDSFTTAAEEPRGFNKATIICDKSNALDVIKYVSTSGNDTTGNGTSGNPYATIGKAAGTGANVVRIKDAAVFAIIGSAPASPVSNEWVVVEPDTGVANYAATVRMDATTRATGVSRLRFRNLNVRISDTSSWIDGGGSRHVWFDNCRFDKNAIGAPTTLIYDFRSTRMHDCFFLPYSTSWSLGEFSTTSCAQMLDGVHFGRHTVSSTQRIQGVFNAKACITDNAVLWPPSATNGAPDPEGFLFLGNAIRNMVDTGEVCLKFSIAITRGAAFVGNEMECCGGTSPAMQLWGDGTAEAADHIVVWHNTVSGDRSNICYNDVGNVLLTNWSVKFNAFQNANIKSDVFGTNGTYVGNWSCLYGVGWEANRAYTTAGFGWEFGGRDCPSSKWPNITATSGQIIAALTFNADSSAFGNDGGNGDYLPVSPNDSISAVPSGRSVIHRYANGQSGSEAGAVPVPVPQSGGGTRCYAA
jgi:hypothetical protein